MFPNMGSMYINIITLVDGGLLLASFIHYAITYFTHSDMIQDLESGKKEENA